MLLVIKSSYSMKAACLAAQRRPRVASEQVAAGRQAMASSATPSEFIGVSFTFTFHALSNMNEIASLDSWTTASWRGRARCRAGQAMANTATPSEFSSAIVTMRAHSSTLSYTGRC